jgi:TRAP-type C4-dicarboxylate transport system permease small subunit
MLQRLFWLLRRADDVIAAVALAAVLYFVTQEMVARSLFGVSFTWTEDLSRVLLIVTVYFGASAVAGEDRHIRVEFILDMLPTRVQRIIRLIIDVACLAFALTAVWLGIRLVRDTAALGLHFAHSEFDLPVWVAQSCIPISFGIMSVRLALRLFGYRQMTPVRTTLQREG